MIKATIAALAVIGVTIAGPGVQAAQAAFDAPGTTMSQTDHRTPRYKGAGIQVVMDTLGVNKGQVISALGSGGTLAELADENGSSGDELVDALMAPVQERVQAALDAGRIDQERADEILADAEQRIADFVFSTHEAGRHHPRFANQKGRFAHIAADTLGMTPQELRDALREGSTLADLAEQAGVSVDDLADALIAPVEDWVQTQVDAGRIDQDRADQRLDTLRQKVIDRING